MALALLMSLALAGARYTVISTPDRVEIADRTTETVVVIVPTVGNMAVSMKVKGREILWWPYSSLDEFKAAPQMSGVPFLGPWANRLDEQAFYANGKRYPFDMTLGNVRGAIPIHGFVTLTDKWRVVDARATSSAAWVTSRLDFFREPSWMKQWPFAHSIDMTYRLQDGQLEVTTSITNLSAEPMPIAIGFHPYFQLTDSPRDDWTIAIGARTHWKLAPTKVPTGETERIEHVFPDPHAARLREYDLDDVFSDLERDAKGRATLSVSGTSQHLSVIFGPNYRSAVVWAPKRRPFICFEPMAGITDAVNLAQRGQYHELQIVAPGATWRESFWIAFRQ
ncbi:MAG TPA: aldose 1-epimerase [Vicinamibacterales bacterium]|nr:aldose 1-epimerase [Vicinamibacterales bacterium]